MAEIPPPSDKPEPEPKPAQQLPPLPQNYLFPTQLLEQWTKIPATQYVNSRLTRGDVDLLLFGLTKNFHAQECMHECMIKWSKGDIEGANEHLADAQRLVIEGRNQIRQFFAALMVSVMEPKKPDV